MVQEIELIEIDIDGRTQKVRPVNIDLDYLNLLNHYWLARYSLGFMPVL